MEPEVGAEEEEEGEDFLLELGLGEAGAPLSAPRVGDVEAAPFSVPLAAAVAVALLLLLLLLPRLSKA